MRVPIIGAFLSLTAAGLLVLNSTAQYEYVVIGSGPGGGPLAANLARGGHSVFLIEAGDDGGDSLVEQVPAWFNFAGEAPELAWQFFVNHFKNETQAKRDNKYTYRLTNGSFYVGLDPPKDAEPLGIYYPRGATVGGSSETNAMYFFIPPDNDWRYIAQLTRDDSWSPENMRKYLVELEKNGYVPAGEQGHGYNGYISTEQVDDSFVTSRPGVSKFLREAIRELEGTNVQNETEFQQLLRRDINRLDTDRYEKPSVFDAPLHVNTKRRRNGAQQYIMDTVNARNEDGSQKYPLTLSTNSLATRVLFHNSTNGNAKPRAYGVEYLAGKALYAADGRFDGKSNGTLHRVTASREVIVSGGAFNTPQILQLSGIGPRSELENLQIPVVRDVPAVGNYLQDNYEIGVNVRANVSWENNPLENCTMNPSLPPSEDPCLERWIKDGSGPYGIGSAPLSIAFRSSVSGNEDCDISLFGAASAEFRGFYPGYSRVSVPDSAFFWSVVKMRTGNEAGTVTLRSTNPQDTPLINFNWFEQNQERDLQAMTEGVNMILRVFNATGAPYAPYNIIEPPPGIETAQSIKDLAYSHHATSTCRLGPKDDPRYCVGPDFKVNGVDGLRVVDASVFPRTPGSFPVAATFMISQKASNIILTDASKSCAK